tara:strand:- start:1491 stop:1667 length:177 start_codon:yes stop_codon:yes gene_type:complete
MKIDATISITITVEVNDTKTHTDDIKAALTENIKELLLSDGYLYNELHAFPIKDLQIK